MEIIRDLEEKFHNLDSKLNSNAKQELANVIYTRDLKRIEHSFKAKKQRYKNGLNECRQEMLDQLIQKRNEQLQQVNEFMESNQQNSLPQLKSLHKSIKQNYAAFAKGLPSVFESIMFRSKLANPLKLAQLVKYTNLLKNEEKVSLAKVKHLSSFKPGCSVHVLPSNRIFFYSYWDKKMLVLNKSGDLIRLKELPEELTYAVQVTATNVIAYNEDNRIVHVYNFNLELVHSIRLERSNYDFKLNNYEIALIIRTTDDDEDDDDNQVTITCYSYTTAPMKKKEIFINTVELKNTFYIDKYEDKACFELWGLNDRFLFIYGFTYSRFTKNINQYAVFLLNRCDGNSLSRYIDCNFMDHFLIYNNEVYFDDYHSNEPLFYVSDLNSDDNDKSVTAVCDTQEGMIANMYLTSNYKYICSERFDYDNLIVKFDLY